MDINLQDVFTYPLQNDVLLRKQKSLKRQLLERKDRSYEKLKIAILGGSTTDDIKNVLELLLLESGIMPDFFQSEYNKFYEDAIFDNPELEDFHPDIIIVFTSMVNIVNLPHCGDDRKTIQEKLDAEFLRFTRIWKNLEDRYHAVLIQNNMDLPYMASLGILDVVEPYGICRFIEALNNCFANYAASHDGFYLHDLHGLAARIGLKKWHNRSQYYAYKFAMDYDVMPDVAWSLKRLICVVCGRTKKCLVLDLDNTLWGGVIGDDGANGIAIGHETPEGEAFTEFQQYVKALKERGVILAVCSKNDEDVAKSGFSHPDSVLSVDDFVAFYANWEPKNVNIRQIAREINIGLDSLVFIDDNPAERAIVRETVPEVSVPEVDSKDVFSYIRAIEENGYFDTVAISEDDRRRSQTYRENRQRADLAETADSYEEFLASLDMEAEIAPFSEIYFDRITQLTNKTNQFNLTTMRCTRADIERMAKAEKYVTLLIRLKDRFGDNGIISLAVGEKRDGDLHIVLWLMSCRVLKRNVEDLMLDALAEQARNTGCKRMVGYYYPTKKNKMVAGHYKSMGFSLLRQDGENTIWELPLSGYASRNKFIRRSR